MAANKKTTQDKEDERYLDLLRGKVNKIMRDKDGRDVIWHILSFHPMDVDSFTGNSTTFYNEGRRSYGIEILAMLEDANPRHYPELILEKLKEGTNE